MATLPYVAIPKNTPKLVDTEAPAIIASLPLSDFSATDSAKRWSIDGWIFWRPNSAGSPTFGAVLPTYGGSQAGAVMRYKLATSDKLNPNVYVRATAALSSPAQGDVGAGVAIRPLVDLPISAQAELQMSKSGVRAELRPALFAVTELPVAKLPLGIRGQAYAQAGYVGGDFATGFADGQVQVDRKIIDLDLGTVRAGAGAWGGVQKGASRLDIGPTASIDIKIAKAPIRVSIDYRHRIAGDAEPQSGIALTLSTGF